jgi:crotonobetainyl-CoA:carnitine CoA-transferase CaiB-like acyl-CoA transferase
LVERIRDVVRDAQLIENEVIVETTSEDPDFQWTVASPFKLDRQRKRPISDPPRLGEHTVAILKELGHSDAQIDQWLAQGVIADRA